MIAILACLCRTWSTIKNDYISYCLLITEQAMPVKYYVVKLWFYRTTTHLPQMLTCYYEGIYSLACITSLFLCRFGEIFCDKNHKKVQWTFFLAFCGNRNVLY